MNVVGASVELKMMLSDGDYGHESAQVMLTAELEPGDTVASAVRELSVQAREHCREVLMASKNLNVRRKLNPAPRLCNHCHEPLDDDIRGYLHPACDEAMRAEQAAKRAEANAKFAEQIDASELEDLPL